MLDAGLNPYIYAGDNPVMNVDPTGLDDYNFNFSNTLLNSLKIPEISSGISLPINLPQLPSLGGIVEGAMAFASDALPYLSALSLSSDTENQNFLTFYHGTSQSSAASLIGGAPLNVGIALDQKIDGVPSFYMATSMRDATFFADRRANPAMIGIMMPQNTFNTLLSADAIVSQIPGGPRGGFVGKQVFVPPQAFPVFDAQRARSTIQMGLIPPASGILHIE